MFSPCALKQLDSRATVNLKGIKTDALRIDACRGRMTRRRRLRHRGAHAKSLSTVVNHLETTSITRHHVSDPPR